MSDSAGARPSVSVVVPVLNEERTIVDLLRSIAGQTYPSDLIEVILADGGSRDGTRGLVERYAGEHPEPRIRLVDNTPGTIPAGLNVAIRHATGDIIVRLDGHSEPAADYVTRCVEALVAGRGDNVGGRWDIRPLRPGTVPAAIAFAAAHPLGAADARYRTGGEPGAVDTVPFGAFRRTTFESVGPFNEALLANEDYEWNARLRASGGIVWFDPGIRCVYRPRDTLGKLARQYYRYGYWKLRMLLGAPGSIRWRQAVPPAGAVVTAGLAAMAPRERAARRALAGLLAAYAAVLGGAALAARRSANPPGCAPVVPAALATMHASWATGFIVSAVEALVLRRGRRAGSPGEPDRVGEPAPTPR